MASGKTKGKATPVNHSMNVKIEGKNVVRNMDMFPGNNKNTPPFPILQSNPAPSVAVAEKDKEEKTYPCAWNEQCNVKHPKKIEYPNESKGVVKRGKYTGDWQMPWDENGSGEKSANITIDHYKREVKKKRIADAEAMFGTNAYPVDNHHLIPISPFGKRKKLKHNAKLVGWDINHSDNGICLPYFVTDIFRHDLQCHRTSHPNYSKIVERDLIALEKECLSYCSKGTQENLLTDLKKSSDRYKRLMKKWKMLLRATAKADEKKSYTQAGIPIPKR